MAGHVALRRYPREWLRPDVIAGLTAAAVIIPKAMAYATIAGLPVHRRPSKPTNAEVDMKAIEGFVLTCLTDRPW